MEHARIWTDDVVKVCWFLTTTLYLPLSIIIKFLESTKLICSFCSHRTAGLLIDTHYFIVKHTEMIYYVLLRNSTHFQA